MDKLKKLGLVGALLGVSSASMAAAPEVTDTVADIDAAAAPIAAVAGASLSVYVGLRVWKMVRRAI
ncbi:major capsid protein [Psychrobacter sp.]|uniref:major capsid protein n=1 Tax=Psychrobacter sp. TaxID=56811 RepID=UPI003F9AD48A